MSSINQMIRDYKLKNNKSPCKISTINSSLKKYLLPEIINIIYEYLGEEDYNCPKFKFKYFVLRGPPSSELTLFYNILKDLKCNSHQELIYITVNKIVDSKHKSLGTIIKIIDNYFDELTDDEIDNNIFLASFFRMREWFLEEGYF